MKVHRLYIGDGDTVPSDARDRAIDSAAAKVAQWYGGCTVLPATGYWAGEREVPTVLETVTDALGVEPVMRALAAQLADELQQECILQTAETVAEFVSGGEPS